MNLLICLCLFYAEGYEVVKTFETPAEDSPYYIAFPYGMDFSPQGKMYATDGKTAQVHIWDKNGKYIKAFSQKGEGPGELDMPTHLDVTEDHIYVWDFNRRIVKFDHDGNYVSQMQVPRYRPGKLIALNEELLMVAYTHFGSPTDIQAKFEVIDQEGNQVMEAHTVKSEWFLSTYEGGNTVSLKAYGPEVDIQRHNGRIFFGYSQNRTIYEVDNSGQIIGKTIFELPTEPPNEEEIAFLNAMTVVGPTGTRVSINSFPNTKISFEHDKAYYTHFIFNEKKGAFILTPLGGTTSMGAAFYKAPFFIADRQSKKVTARGNYAFPEDSFVFHQDGRSVVFELQKDDEYKVQEIKLKGF